jgi:hypothetical protein
LTLPKLSIADKLYAIFALMATMTVALSVATLAAARNHAALTTQLESANGGRGNACRHCAAPSLVSFLSSSAR